jgi:hypothetical protein
MTLEEFLQAIQPNLTVFACLFAFLILFIRLFWFFLKYETTIRDENLTRVKDLLSNSLDVQIVKPLQEELGRNIELGYKYAVDLFYPKEFDPTTQSKQRKLIVEDGDNLQKIANMDTTEIVQNLSGQGIAQKTGQDLFIFLEKRYQKTAIFVAQYEKTKGHCRATWISCLFLAFLTVIGIVLCISENDLFLHLWIFVVMLTFVIGVVSFVLLFACRHKLIKDWEKLQIYGE